MLSPNPVLHSQLTRDITMETDVSSPPPLPPPLPLPPLDETLDSYLDNLKSILSAEDWRKTSEEVLEFRTEHGQRLQRRLEERRKETDNWAYEWWLNDMYLKVSWREDKLADWE